MDGSGYIEWAEWVGIELLEWVDIANGTALDNVLLSSAARLLDVSSCDGKITVQDIAKFTPEKSTNETHQQLLSSLITDWALDADRMPKDTSGLELADLQRMLEWSALFQSEV
mmetsp:Transcript_50357/g.94307  ORF Transcript_50357/g.94307 Transcript_50357/m.94307 type:complete len:113 (+) Transcript_50357:2-340(+)